MDSPGEEDLLGWGVRLRAHKGDRNRVTHDNIMKVARNMNFAHSPSGCENIKVGTSRDSQFPVTQEALQHQQTRA